MNKQSNTYRQREERKRRLKTAFATMRETDKAALLYADIYEIIYYADEHGDFYKYGFEIIEKAGEAWEANDTYLLEELLSNLRLPKHKRDIPFHIMLIVDLLELNDHEQLEVYEPLSWLRNNIEAEITREVIRRVKNELPHLERGYYAAKKTRYRRRKKTLTPIRNTYEHELRRERHFLEKLLMYEGVGINRAKSISKILSIIPTNSN